MVVGKLLDLDAPEDFIRQLLNSVGHQCPVDELVEHVSSDVMIFGQFVTYSRGVLIRFAQRLYFRKKCRTNGQKNLRRSSM